MYHAVYSPDFQLIALFKSDDQELIPTQHIALQEYLDEYTSEFCTVRTYDSFTDIQEFLP